MQKRFGHPVVFACIVHLFSLVLGAICTIALPLAFRALESDGDIYFSLHDLEIQKPSRSIKLPYIVVFALSIMGPLAVMALIEILRQCCFGREFVCWKRVGCHFYCMCMGLFMTQLVTEAIKSSFRLPRPDLLDRCEPRIVGKNFITTKDCTTDSERLLANGLRSFPSGHTSMAIAASSFLVMYLWDAFSMGNRKGSGGVAVGDDGNIIVPTGAKGQVFSTQYAPHYWEWFLVVSPLFWGLTVGGQKIQENRHHLEDVLAGMVLGITVAYFAYKSVPMHLKARHQRFTARTLPPGLGTTAGRTLPPPMGSRPPPTMEGGTHHTHHTHQSHHTSHRGRPHRAHSAPRSHHSRHSHRYAVGQTTSLPPVENPDFLSRDALSRLPRQDVGVLEIPTSALDTSLRTPPRNTNNTLATQPVAEDKDKKPPTTPGNPATLENVTLV